MSRAAGMVLMGELSATAHWVGSDQVWATSLGWSPRALCGRPFVPSALAEPLPPLCPACAAVQRDIAAIGHAPHRRTARTGLSGLAGRRLLHRLRPAGRRTPR